ncbi:MAG TPA: TIGR04552 family protein [Holophagaceae bacterium]|nr:TIGR04552 family protein [Holophagaceae bacterium]
MLTTSQSLFPLPPEVTRVILGGGSSIDLEGLRCGSPAEARDFAKNYGYDMGVPSQRVHVQRVCRDAVAFLEGVILDGTGLRLPEELRGLDDPLNLLVWASEREEGGRRGLRARWACALLRVMHTLFHIDHNINLRFLPEIQRQVFDPYDRHLRMEGGRWKLKGAYEVPLVAMERKENKDRASMLLKLLHKPENVAETIYDQIGIRLVAEDHMGALLVLRFLLDHHVLMATHIKPSRSRNRMIDTDALEAWMAGLPPALELQAMTPEARRELCRDLAQKGERPADNPHMAQEYTAVQFTARSLIRLPNPASEALDRVRTRLGALGHPELMKQLGLAELAQEQEELAFFFAHEVQIMEDSGFRSSQSGPASHAEYKQRQREAARRRVLQGIL